MLICKDCGFYAGIIPGTMQKIIILAVLPTFFVNTEPANKTLELHSNRCIYSNRTVRWLYKLLKFDYLYVVKEINLSSDSGNCTLMKLWSIMERNRAQRSIIGHTRKNFETLLKSKIGNLKSVIGPGLLQL